jgi:hypothetical protein
VTPDDAVLAYTAEHGWHLIPLLELGYGTDLDAAVSLADQAETLCAHDREFVRILRAGGWTDTAITDALGVVANALPARPATDLLDQLHTAAQQVSA